MRKRTSTTAVCLLAAGMACAAPAGTAVADPKGEPFMLDCGSAGTFEVVTPPGQGMFTPGFDQDSNKRLIPLRFRDFFGTISGPGGFSESFSDPTEQVKGSGKQRADATCTFTFSDTFTLTAEEAEAEGLPGPGTYTFAGGGTVVVKITGR